MKQEIIQHINQLVRVGEPFLFVINYQGDKAYIKKLSEIEPHMNASMILMARRTPRT